MIKKIKGVVINTFGWGLVFLGIIGIFLPFLQGILFILAGLYLLSYQSPYAKRVLKNIRRQFPALDKKIKAARIKARNLFK